MKDLVDVIRTNIREAVQDGNYGMDGMTTGCKSYRILRESWSGLKDTGLGKMRDLSSWKAENCVGKGAKVRLIRRWPSHLRKLT